ncbi:DUF92 domain-containing protein [Candidatus Neomarinimicrobiota bacterium]
MIHRISTPHPIDLDAIPVLPLSMPYLPILPSPFLTWLLFLGAILGLLALSEWLSAKIGMQPENSRQLVHVIVGVFIFLCRFIFLEPLFPIITGLIFIVVNLVTLRAGRFESMHATNRVSYGTVYFPVSFVILALLFWHRDPIALQIGILLLAFADPIASWIGTRYGRTQFTLWRDPKSPAGTSAMFVASLILPLAGFLLLLPMSGESPLTLPALLLALIPLAALATLAEAQSYRGSDNLSVPLSAALFVFLFRSLGPTDYLHYLLWTAGSGALLALAARMKALAPSGALTAWGIGLLIYLAGGWLWVIPIVAFFLLSSLLTRLSPGAAAAPNPDTRHAGKRNLIQVIANGGVPLLVAAAFGIWGHDHLYIVFLAALAAATADTWGTEIGGWQKRLPRNIINWQPVPKGESGGITLAGTLGALAGAACLAGIGVLLRPDLIGFDHWLSITLIGFLAAAIDSVLGATVQVRYLIYDTSQIIEDRTKTELETVLHSGWWWLDNNMVNLVCTGSGAVLGLLWILN